MSFHPGSAGDWIAYMEMKKRNKEGKEMNELVKVENQGALSCGSNTLTREQIELVKKTVAKGATDAELQLFLYQAGRTGLDPLLRQIHSISRKSKNEYGEWENSRTIQVGIDGFRIIAERTGKYDGQDPPVFEYDTKGELASATVNVYRKDISRPFAGTAYFKEYCQKKNNGEPTRFWRDMPMSQLAKCAEALAFRKAFPLDLSGLYSHEEMQQAIVETDEKPVPKPTAQKPAPQAQTPPTPAEKPEVTWATMSNPDAEPQEQGQCVVCGATVTPELWQQSLKKYRKCLCRKCQAAADAKKAQELKDNAAQVLCRCGKDITGATVEIKEEKYSLRDYTQKKYGVPLCEDCAKAEHGKLQAEKKVQADLQKAAELATSQLSAEDTKKVLDAATEAAERAKRLADEEAYLRSLEGTISEAVAQDPTFPPCVTCGMEIIGYMPNGVTKAEFITSKLGACYCEKCGAAEMARLKKMAQEAQQAA
ncbi:MAG: phage recombination protein Bet [Candidatus Xenobiia bacterium LiM19]